MPQHFQEEKPQDCPVCFESLEKENKTLSCGHWVHMDCIIKSKKDCCPMCRQQVSMSILEKYQLQELQYEERLKLSSQTINTDINLYSDEDYIEEEQHSYNIDEEDDDFLMPSEQHVVIFTALSPFRYEDEAILYDGRLLSFKREGIRIVVKCAFTSEFEARNFCSDIEQRDEVVSGSVVLRDLTNYGSLIQTGSYNYGESLIDF